MQTVLVLFFGLLARLGRSRRDLLGVAPATTESDGCPDR